MQYSTKIQLTSINIQLTEEHVYPDQEHSVNFFDIGGEHIQLTFLQHLCRIHDQLRLKLMNKRNLQKLEPGFFLSPAAAQARD